MPIILYRLFPIIVIAFSLGACASARLATPEEDTVAKQFNVKNGTSNIYIYRNEGAIVSTGISVSIDDKPASDIDNDTYIFQSVSPGKRTITAHAENTETMELVTEAGKNYFIWLETRIGVITNHAHFHSVSAEKGKAGVKACKLVE